MFVNGYTYTDFHEMNLDWVINTIKKLLQAFEDFKGANSLVFADPILWDISTQYLKNTVVLSSTGDAYLSIEAVPFGIDIDNGSYWLKIFDFATYVRTANANLTINQEFGTRASKQYNIDDWLLVNDVLYKVIVAIPSGGDLIVGTNITHFTVEDFCKAWVSYANALITQYKNDIDASELDYKNQLDASVTATTANLQAQLNAAIAGATVDSEVINARIGFDGHTYSTLGEAVRDQVKFLHDKGYMERGPVYTDGRTTCGACTLPGTYTFTTSDVSNITDLPTGWVGGGFLQVYTSGTIMWQIVKNTTAEYIRYGSNGQWFNYENDDLEIKGNVIDLGYTAIGSCTQSGVYFFTTANAANITDLPYGWIGGGYVVVYNSGAALWQEIKNNSLSLRRYGTTGLWFDVDSNNVIVNYTNGSGVDSSTEHIDVNITSVKTSENFVRYAIGHCVDNERNCDVWRLMYIYKTTLNDASSVAITRSGEFECALKLDSRSDFAGGFIHGDEIDQNVTFLCDGKPTAKASVGGVYKEFKIIRNSILYDPLDSTTPIAEHGVEYVFTSEGLTINQSIKWLAAVPLANCFLAMYPVIKNYSGKRFTNVSFEVESNPASNFSDTFNKATSITEYGSGVESTISVDKYPSGLTGGDCAVITDNDGIDYNKIYFVVCTGGSSSVNELWLSSCKYDIKA